MDSKNKREEITALIDNIKTHSDRLSENPSIPLLELSVILAKITRLHEKAVVLKYILAKEQNHEEEEFGSIDIHNEEKRLEQEMKKWASSDDDEESNSEVEEESSEKETETEKETPSEPSSEQQEELGEVEVQATVEEKEKEEPKDLERQVSLKDIEDEEEEISSKPDLNEQYSEGDDDPSLSEQLKKQPIADLLTAIGLNERYLYANELFGGDIEEFRNVIKTLNEFDNVEDAIRYFEEELRRSYGWEKDNELANALQLLVRRRYQ